MSVAASTGCVSRETVLLVQGAANARASADLPLPVVAIGESATTAVLNTLHTLLTEGGDLTLRSVSTYSHQPLDVVAAVVTALGSVLGHTATTEFEPFRASLAPTPQTGQPFDVTARHTSPSGSPQGAATGTSPEEQPPSTVGGCGGTCRLALGLLTFSVVMGLIYRLTRA